MYSDLGTRLNDSHQYRSAGERHIAAILTKYGIPFQYESPILVRDEHSLMRIWYPDFFLPGYGIYVEYYGMEGNPEYDSGVVKKNEAYARTGADVIPIHQTALREDLETLLLRSLYKKLEQRLRQFSYRVAAKEPRKLSSSSPRDYFGSKTYVK
jgi:hypothetical protein